MVFSVLICVPLALPQFSEKFQEVKEAAKLAREKSQEKMETSSDQSQVHGAPRSSSVKNKHAIIQKYQIAEDVYTDGNIFIYMYICTLREIYIYIYVILEKWEKTGNKM